ncbi:MAG: hypothetical protein ACLUHK_04400 [Eubacteriales bacterium]
MGYETEELVSVTVKPDIHVLLPSRNRIAASAQRGTTRNGNATVTEQGNRGGESRVEER